MKFTITVDVDLLEIANSMRDNNLSLKDVQHRITNNLYMGLSCIDAMLHRDLGIECTESFVHKEMI